MRICDCDVFKMRLSNHFNHGGGYRCLLCVKELQREEDLAQAAAKTVEETALSTRLGGLELKLLMDKRELEESELLMLLCACACSDITEKIHAYYYIFGAEVLGTAKFKRFRTNNSNKALRRKIRLVEKDYGSIRSSDNLTVSQCDSILYEVSKHPIEKLVERSRSVLDSLKRIYDAHEEIRLEVSKFGQVAEGVSRDISIAGNIAAGGRQRAKKRISDALDYGTTGRQESQSRSPSATAGPLMLSADLDDFFSHFLVQYDDTTVELDKVYLEAFTKWIPQLAVGAQGRKRQILNMLKSLVFMSIREKKRYEALRIVKVLLRHLDKDTVDYWRFKLFNQYLSEEVDKNTFTSDLYHQFVNCMSSHDRQIYLSLRFDALIKGSSFVHALDLAGRLSIPELHTNVGVWIRTVECCLTINLLYMQKSNIATVLSQQLDVILKAPAQTMEEEPKISRILKQLVAAVSKRFPIHLRLLKNVSALALTVVCAFEGQEAAEKTRKELEQLRLEVSLSSLVEKLKACGFLAFDAGNLQLAKRLLDAAVKSSDARSVGWEVWCYLGQLEAQRGNLADASKYLLQATELAEEHLGRSNSFGRCLLFYAHALQLQGNLYAAEQLYEQAYALFKAHRNYSMLALCLFAHATLLWKSQAWEASFELLYEAEESLPALRGREKRNQSVVVFAALTASHGECGNAGLTDHYRKKTKRCLEQERLGEFSSACKMLLEVTTWDEWRSAVLVVSPDYMKLIGMCLYPMPSTGDHNAVVIEEEPSLEPEQ